MGSRKLVTTKTHEGLSLHGLRTGTKGKVERHPHSEHFPSTSSLRVFGEVHIEDGLEGW